MEEWSREKYIFKRTRGENFSKYGHIRAETDKSWIHENVCTLPSTFCSLITLIVLVDRSTIRTELLLAVIRRPPFHPIQLRDFNLCFNLFLFSSFRLVYAVSNYCKCIIQTIVLWMTLDMQHCAALVSNITSTVKINASMVTIITVMLNPVERHGGSAGLLLERIICSIIFNGFEIKTITATTLTSQKHNNPAETQSVYKRINSSK